MPSRKRNKGKERKAKKEAIAAKNDDRLDNTWRGWALGEDVLSSDEKKRIHCEHGCDVTAPTDRDHPVCCFMNSFMGNKSDWAEILYLLPQIWDDDNYRNMAIHILTRIGINNLLLIKDHPPTVQRNNIACTIMILENYNEAMKVSEVFLTLRVASKVRDLQGSNNRDLYKFFSKRVSCSCLKEAYHYHQAKIRSLKLAFVIIVNRQSITVHISFIVITGTLTIISIIENDDFVIIF